MSSSIELHANTYIPVLDAFGGKMYDREFRDITYVRGSDVITVVMRDEIDTKIRQSVGINDFIILQIRSHGSWLYYSV